jgi:cytochrome c553
MWRLSVLVPLRLSTMLMVATAARADDKARVEDIVQGKCFICHGADGESSSRVFARLAGQHADVH